MQTWRLDTHNQTLVLAGPMGAVTGVNPTINPGIKTTGVARVIYWGAPLPTSENLEQLAHATALDVTGGMLDLIPDLSILPDGNDTYPGQPGLAARGADGHVLAPVWAFASADTATGLTLTYKDAALGLTYTARFGITASGVITARASLTADAPITVEHFCAPALPAPQLADHILEFSGRWVGEFQMDVNPWTPGARLRDNPTGRTGHEHFPGVILPARGTQNTSGAAHALSYGWSGGHRMVAEELPDGRRRVSFGHASGSHRAPARQFDTGILYLAYSGNGLNGCATAFQHLVRDELVTWPHPDRPRPVHYNCWEAVYFRHDLAELCEIATHAAALGAERFVLDDGWFGKRDDDTTSLGDWWIDTRKFPNGLAPLIDHVHAAGMTFGIWFEPEMINLASDTARAHPNWILGRGDQIPGRQQYVLDMSRDDVRAYLFEKMSDVLAAAEIDYIKWDHNRVLPFTDAAQAAGTLALLAQLRAAFLEVEIESCSSGGGRIDYGILAQTQRVWLSDSNDAIERMRIQHNAALFLPTAITGSHVGPRQCHTSGRVIDIETRAWVAAARHMGFEMDPRELTDHEAAVLSRVTAWYKANRAWMMAGDLLRLDAADPAVLAEQHLARDGDQFVVFANKQDTSRQILPRPLRLTGLDAGATYDITLENADEAHHLSRGTMAIKDGALRLSGAALMQSGVNLPWSFPARVWVVMGRKIAEDSA